MSLLPSYLLGRRDLPGGVGCRDWLADGRFRLANKDYLKVADLAAIEADYYRSIENYEKVAKSAVNNNLMRFSVKDYFLKAGICHLASGVCLSCTLPKKSADGRN